LEPFTVLASRKKSSITRLNANSRIFKLILKAIQEKKGENIVALDLRKIPEAVSDYFVICEATSTTQVRAIADFVEETVKKELGEIPYRHEGYNVSQWVLIDYINIVVHIMQPSTRKFYKLEEMWSDAILQEY
jgi:ribosome-associated protein